MTFVQEFVVSAGAVVYPAAWVAAVLVMAALRNGDLKVWLGALAALPGFLGGVALAQFLDVRSLQVGLILVMTVGPVLLAAASSLLTREPEG